MSQYAQDYINSNCLDSCNKKLFHHEERFARYPAMNDAQYLLARMFLELEKNETRFSEVATTATQKYLDEIAVGKKLFCGDDVTEACEQKAFNYAVTEAKQGFTKIHIYRKSSEVVMMSRISSYPTFTLISNMGAQLGLWAGLTFLTLYDLVVKYAKLLFVKNMGKRLVKKAKALGGDERDWEEDAFTKAIDRLVYDEERKSESKPSNEKNSSNSE